MPAHPHVAWVNCVQVAPGQFRCVCTVCNAQMDAAAPAQGADMFARVHSEHKAAPTHYGIGDMIAGVTKAVGIKPCSPCEARRRAMNGWLRR